MNVCVYTHILFINLFYIYPSPEINVAQSLQGQLRGSHFLICFLNIASDAADLMLSSTKVHILGPRYLNVSIPNFSVFGIPGQ